MGPLVPSAARRACNPDHRNHIIDQDNLSNHTLRSRRSIINGGRSTSGSTPRVRGSFSRIHILLLLTFLCLSLFAQPAAPVQALAGTYYVATNGSDSGDGSAARPWKTIQYALTRVSDGSTILVKPGLYNGMQRLSGNFGTGVIVRSEVPYMAQLRNSGPVISAMGRLSGITIEGFDMAHSGPGASAIVVWVNAGSETGAVHHLTFRNNIIHDSYNNDIMKVASGATNITIDGNVFYNQTGSDEHLDINSTRTVTVQRNIFFNNFAGSGRSNQNTTSSYIVIKDSGANTDEINGTTDVNVRQNVFLNWQGLPSSAFIMVGEDDQPFYEARFVMIENNMFIGNSPYTQQSPLTVWGSADITFRNNTVTGDLPTRAYAMALAKARRNLPNANIRFYNNIWADQTGTMGAGADSTRNDFSDTKPESTASFVLHRNVYWNGGKAIPSDSADKINVTNDAGRIIADPGLPNPSGAWTPMWKASTRKFTDGSLSIREAFVKLVRTYGAIPAASRAANLADAANSPTVDILGTARGGSPDIGAYEAAASLSLMARPNNGSISLAWSFGGSLPSTATWQIAYDGPTASAPSPVTLPATARSYTLTGVQNYVPYTFTLSAVDGSTVIVRSTVKHMATDRFVFVPTIQRTLRQTALASLSYEDESANILNLEEEAYLAEHPVYGDEMIQEEPASEGEDLLEEPAPDGEPDADAPISEEQPEVTE